ncbi:hypothetical protein DYBT9623_04193 [Dyadobacter sp. CECT 9623]|uniref:Uncharacterized protein n=1 Tax=Dyadobacter linearis TaxID=2823330 RepID=A0ABM8UV90_9BACT|nr:hypothetical protein [Dyadobacter sp. CECT 9623]CAG5072556.1 hypothetical protein DYBT9623_04193 [Dyadobacter sp. CECT 9623]
MKRIHIEKYSKNKKLSIYTVRYDDCVENQTDRFLDKYLRLGFEEDIMMIKSWLRNLENRGAKEHYLRHEKRANAGPIRFSKLRIYCIRCHENLIILDGGGEKKGQKTQDGAETNAAMELMNAVDIAFVEKIKDRDIVYSFDKMDLSGELFVDIT